MLGAIIGDYAGSIYEMDNIRSTDFPFFSDTCRFTDDTIMTSAVMDALLTGRDFAGCMRRYGMQYPDAGYGSRFLAWVNDPAAPAYNSFGNGSAMRVSPVGWIANSLEEALEALDVSHFDTSNVTNMKNMFYRCASLAKIDLSGFDFSGVTSMKDMFTDCRSLREVILSDTILRAKCLVKRVINKNKLPKGAFIDEHGDPCYYGYGNAGPYSAYEDRIAVPDFQLEYEDFSFDQTTQAEWREYLGLHGLAVITVVPHRTK